MFHSKQIGARRQVWAVACLAALSVGVAACNRSEPELTEKVSVTPESQPLSSEEQRLLHITAGEVVTHVNQARDAIARKDLTAAADRVQEAMDRLGDVQRMEPRYKLTTDTRVGTSDIQSTEHVKPDLVPIASDVEEIALMAPIRAARAAAHAEQAHQTKQGKPKQNSNSSAWSSEVETYRGDEYTKAEIDVDAMKSQLTLAQAALDSGDPMQADAALKSAQTDGVVLEFVAVNRPLKRAADNLNAALFNLAAHHRATASRDLASAVAALKQYEGPTGNTRTPEVRKLQEELAQVRADLDAETSANQDQKQSSDDNKDQSKTEHLVSRVRDAWRSLENWL